MSYSKPTLHLIGMFHTIPNHDYDHCAFTGKVLRFSSMMKNMGYNIVEYSNGESISEANEKIQILTKQELLDIVGPPTSLKALHGIKFTPVWYAFHNRLLPIIKSKVKPFDIVIHPYGSSHSELLKEIPQAYHTELGIGYSEQDFGAYRIFESYQWMHYTLGNHFNKDNNGNIIYNNGTPSVGKWGTAYQWVAPNYYNPNDWEPKYEKGGYLLYFGRVISSKGLYIVKEIAERVNEEVIIAGMGDTHLFHGKNMKIIGPVTGQKERSDLLRGARAVLMPTQYIEPFGSVAIEAMMCGTPVITSDFGAFPETIQHGKTGYRCHTLGDYMKAVELAPQLDRKYIRDNAVNLYSYQTVGQIYDNIFKQISNLKNGGWYNLEPIFVK